MKLPADVDELMWQIAESGDTDAVTEFHEKYPHFSSEMTKRIAMVTGFKGSRPKSASKKRDRFMPSRNVAPAPRTLPIWSIAALVILFAASISFATYGIIKFTNQKQEQIQPFAQTNPYPTMSTGGTGNSNPDPSQTQQAPLPDNKNQTPPVATIQPFDRSVTVVSGRVSINTALNDIASQAGIRIELAPGFEEIEIMIDYREVPAIQVIDDMGRNFGFTALRQTHNSILLIPAEDANRRDPQNSPGSSRPAQDQSTQNPGALLELPGR